MNDKIQKILGMTTADQSNHLIYFGNNFPGVFLNFSVQMKT